MSKISLAVVGLAASLGAYAAVPTNAAPFQVVVPCIHDGFQFVLEGLYVQPTASNLDYSAVTTTVTTASLTDSATQVNSINPNYNFGFRVGVGYVFKDSGNDVQLDWTHFNRSTSNSVGPFGPIVTGTTIDVNPIDGSGARALVTGETANVSASADMKYDAVDLNVGQFLDIGTRLRTRMFAGLRFARVEDNLTTDQVIANPAETDGITLQLASGVQDSKFTGVGPQFGIDSSYNISDCFGLVGHVSTGLLVGQVKTSADLDTATSTIDTGVTTVTVASTDTNMDSITRVVPALDAKLGFDYTWPINNDKSELSLEVGYQATQYIDVFDRVSVDGTRATSGFGLNGPYLNLNFRM